MQERAQPQFEQIAAFVAVVEHGGISAAARALNRDPSAISRRLDALEARLGVRLLSRTTRRITLTEAGAAYLTRVRAIIAELLAAESEAAEGAATPRGLLRLSLPATYARRWIAPRLPEFVTAYPEVQLELLHTDRFVDLVAEGFDAAVRIGELADSSLMVSASLPSRRSCAPRRITSPAGARRKSPRTSGSTNASGSRWRVSGRAGG